MKNPNGYGSVIKLSGKRRRPYMARVTVGFDINIETGKAIQKYKPIGYYKSRPEAMIALAEYNKDPYDIDAKKITFAEIYKRWKKEKFKGNEEGSSFRGYRSAYDRSEPLYNMIFIDVRKTHMQTIIDNMDLSHSAKRMNKTLYKQLYKFANENDITDKNYADYVTIEKNDDESDREPFLDSEIKKMQDNLNEHKDIDMALIMIYTGLRPSEMLSIEINNIYLDARYLIAGMKTEAGKNRIIPINKKIQPLIEKRMDEGNKYLFLNTLGNQLKYNVFRPDFLNLMEELKMKHKPHDCRHTFATLMDNADANKLSIKKIMGHASQDVTDKVYTHKSISELLKAVDLI